jgi:hypothetical protein
MDRLCVVERPNPPGHQNGGGTHWVAWDREFSIVTYGDTRDEAVFMAGSASQIVASGRTGSGQPAHRPEPEWTPMEEARAILDGTSEQGHFIREALGALKEAELSGVARKTIEEIRKGHGLPPRGG